MSKGIPGPIWWTVTVAWFMALIFAIFSTYWGIWQDDSKWMATGIVTFAIVIISGMAAAW